MKEIKQKDVGLILQKIYDSEINIRIGWFWDGGIDYGIGHWGHPQNKNDTDDKNANRDIAEAVSWLVADIKSRFPKSSFIKWFEKEL